MSHTTPVYALPYPDEADTADVPRDVQALAQRIEAVLPNASFPTGMGADWYATAAPAGFLLCDGSAVSRATFAALFAVLGSSWGGGDGINTFNLPDCRGRVIVGVGTQADVASIGLTDGAPLANRRVKHFHPNQLSATHSLALPAHGHAVSDPGHWHGFTSNDSGGPNVPHSSASQDTSYGSSGGIGGTPDGPVRLASTGLGVGNPTSFPAINGGVTINGGIGPQANVPQDGPSYVVANKVIKT